MPDNNKIDEFLDKLKPCIDKGELDACVDEAERLAEEMGIWAEDLLNLSTEAGINSSYRFAYVLALVAANGLEGSDRAVAYSNAGGAALDIGETGKAEENCKKAIQIEPNFSEAHSNYGLLLHGLKRTKEAEEHYKKAIEIYPESATAHSNYGLLLHELKKTKEAEEYYKKAIEIYPNYPNAHGAYGLLLIEIDNRSEAWKETEKASSLLVENRELTQSHLAKAWFYNQYSDKYFNQRKFHESGEDARKAGDEYLKAAETTEGALKDDFSQQGNILKAKSFVRKVPKKSWHMRILYQLGKKRDITDIINNLKKAASYYEKAAMCPIEDKRDICNACHFSITVFSETLSTMDAFMNKKSTEIDKKEWGQKLDSARLIYDEKGMDKGVALVDTLKQLIKCVDGLAVHRENGLDVQKEKSGKCYKKLVDVSENLDGALSVLAEHSMEAIRDYAKQQGMGGFGDYEQKKSIWNHWFVKGAIVAIATIFLNLLSSKLYDLNILATIWNYIKSLIP